MYGRAIGFATVQQSTVSLRKGGRWWHDELCEAWSSESYGNGVRHRRDGEKDDATKETTHEVKEAVAEDEENKYDVPPTDHFVDDLRKHAGGYDHRRNN
ncbi:hypothetical protein L1987_40327 [Smallanthus sonchifolius]|uniref:Uncharacterized protein n=1 Tax=Smallanthus sonchifolius TaxID=185202 RepID=A0ACB9GT02_9ASTR|nr:hypothetical protein L1987_40327 [Smallanthus sonchifolius]